MVSCMLKKFKVCTFNAVPFLHSRLIYFVVIVIQDTIQSPMSTKLSGLYLPISIIALMGLINTSCGLFTPFFRGVAIKPLAYSLVCFDVLVILGSVMYLLLPDVINAYVYLAIGFVTDCFGSIGFNVLRIKISTVISQKYADYYEDFQISSDFIQSAAGVTGLSIAVLLSLVASLDVQMMFLIFMSFISIIVYLRQIKELLKISD